MTKKSSFLIFGFLAVAFQKPIFASQCPSLKGFYVEDIHKKSHFEFYDILKDGKIDRYHHRTFNIDGNATKEEFLTDGKTYSNGRDSEVTAKCKNGEFVRTVHAWTPKDANFAGTDFIDERRSRKDANGNLSVYHRSINTSTDGYYHEERTRMTYRSFDGENFPADDTRYTVVSHPKLSASGIGNPDPTVGSLIDQVWVEGRRMSASLDGRVLSMLVFDPKSSQVTAGYPPNVKFLIGRAADPAPLPGDEFKINIQWDPAIANPKLVTWHENFEQCVIEESKKNCQHNRYDFEMGELDMGLNHGQERISEVLETKIQEVNDPRCCADL